MSFSRANMRKEPPKKPVGNKADRGGPGSRSVNARNVRSANQGEKLPSIDRANPTFDYIDNAIHEYLMKRQLYHTLEVFKDELNFVPKQKANIDYQSETELIDYFDKGQREQFFAKWNKLIPQNNRQKDSEYNKLEFYLHVYFVVFGAHPASKKPQKALDKNELQKFKIFLDTKGSELAKTSEFLPYYALPYVQNPMEHPSFRRVFTQDWVQEVRQRLVNYLSNASANDSNLVLMQMFQAYSRMEDGGGSGSMEVGEYKNAIAQLEGSNKELMGILNEFNVKYGNLLRNYNILQKSEEIARSNLLDSHSKWINFSKELLTISKDLLKMIDNSRTGVPIQEKVIDILKKKVSNYEGFLNSNIEDLITQSQDPSVFDKYSTSQDLEMPDPTSISPAGSYMGGKNFVSANRNMTQPKDFPLNFEEINKAFVNGNNEKVICALLQALRWRITRAKGAHPRREAIIAYSKHDLLGLTQEHDQVLEKILVKCTRRVREFAARLINALASDYSGRSYLLESDKMVFQLIQILQSESGDTISRRNCLGALQKLSLRRRPQIIMIEHDLIKWIVQTLKNEKDTLGEYSYEYATALFMNLSLRSLGKKKCEDPRIEVLEVFNDLLEHENLQVRTFVNGTLYSLLSRPILKERAKALGMNEILNYLMEHSEERFKKQIQYIKDQLNSDKTEDDAASDANEDENDVDDIDEDEEIGEDEDTEDNIAEPGLLVGEDLLAKYFSITGQEAMRQTTMIQEAMEESKTHRLSQTYNTTQQNMEEPLNRPTTPSMINKLYGIDPANQKLPLELQSRPKIVRTPVNTDKAKIQQLMKQRAEEQNENRQSFNELVFEGNPPQKPAVKNKTEEVRELRDKKINEQSDEYSLAFETKPRILRTPPNQNIASGLGQSEAGLNPDPSQNYRS